MSHKDDKNINANQPSLEKEEALLDQAIEAVCQDVASEADEKQALAGIWNTLQGELEGGRGEAKLRTLDDYIALIPDYLDGKLSDARAMLLEEEARNSIPLRRALQSARDKRSGAAAQVEVAEDTGGRVLRWGAMAAALAVALFGAFWILPRLEVGDQTLIATVDSIEGQLFQVSDAGLVAIEAGTVLDGHDVVRTAKGSRAVLKLDDESLVEVDERSQLSVVRRRRGNQIEVDRGRIIVEASEQGSGRLGVTTDEMVVSVKGTIFGVSHGTKGSRVAVIEGEVVVDDGKSKKALRPGDLAGTHATFAGNNFEDEIAWSNHADDYLGLLRELNALRKDINQLMAATPRYSTRLLDLAPADAVAYFAIPNATAKLADAYDMVSDRLADNQTTQQVWNDFAASEDGAQMEEMVGWFREVSDYLGEETVISLALAQGANGPEPLPVLLAEVTDPNNLEVALEERFQELELTIRQKVEEHRRNNPDQAHNDADFDFPVKLVRSPADLSENELGVWVQDDLLIATPSAALMNEIDVRAKSGQSAFVGSSFYQLLADRYQEGVQFLGAVDVARLLEMARSYAKPEENAGEELAVIGLDNAQYVLVERRSTGTQAETSFELTFDGPRHGLASWLAEPGAMGALEFFSPDATVASALVFKDPAEMFDAILGFAGREDAEVDQGLAEFREHTGLDLRDDILATLGGEFAAGLDGPALPVPSWKTVFEVYDEVGLQNAIAQIVDRANLLAQMEDKDFNLVLAETQSGGRTFYSLTGDFDGEIDIDEDIPLGGITQMHYTFAHGYMVAGPSRILVEQAVATYESGSSLTASAAFRELLPEDEYLDFSGVVYNRMGDLLGEMMSKLPIGQQLTAEQQQTLDEIQAESGASLYALYGGEDSIRVVALGPSNLPLAGIGRMLGLGTVIGDIGSATPLAQAFRAGPEDAGLFDDQQDPVQSGGVTWQ